MTRVIPSLASLLLIVSGVAIAQTPAPGAATPATGAQQGQPPAVNTATGCSRRSADM